MNSLIFIAKTEQIITDYLDSFYQTHQISQFDRTIITAEGSIGIESIRDMQRSLYLAPYKGQKKSIIIQSAQLLTIEAQNALLKVLEEPPPFVYFILLAPTTQQFLPTILSRCQILIGEKEQREITEEETEKVKEDIMLLKQQAPISDRFALAEKLATDKENLSTWFETSILLLRDQLLTSSSDKTQTKTIVHTLGKLQKAYEMYQTTNVSPRVLLEHTFLSL